MRLICRPKWLRNCVPWACCEIVTFWRRFALDSQVPESYIFPSHAARTGRGGIPDDGFIGVISWIGSAAVASCREFGRNNRVSGSPFFDIVYDWKGYAGGVCSRFGVFAFGGIFWVLSCAVLGILDDSMRLFRLPFGPSRGGFWGDWDSLCAMPMSSVFLRSPVLVLRGDWRQSFREVNLRV